MRLRRQAGLTFELTPTAEAGGVSPVCDDATAGADRAYAACRSGSGVERGVRRRWAKVAGLFVVEPQFCQVIPPLTLSSAVLMAACSVWCPGVSTQVGKEGSPAR